MEKALISKAGGRKHNEDSCSHLETGGFGCYVLADGLGGHRGGAVASKTIVDTMLESFKSSPGFSTALLSAYLEQTRSAFLSAQKENGSLSGMKATLVVLLTDFKALLWGHIGDSRLYLFRAGELHFQTSDHSVPRHLVDSGDIKEEDIRFHEDRNRLTRSFDGGDLSRFEMCRKPFKLSEGDALLLCSDGFWEYVLEKEMQSDLKSAGDPANWLDRMEKRLLNRAEAKHDNYSAIAIIN